MSLWALRGVLWVATALFAVASAQAGVGEQLQALFAMRGEHEHEIRLIYKEKGALFDEEHKLEAIVYTPTTPNGSLVLFSHGSMSSPDQMKQTYRLLPIAQAFTDRGYTFVIWMRAGRGQSEGQTEEYSAGQDCDVTRTDWSLERNRDQMRQVIAQLKARYQLQQVYLIGHSRGGIISANYASHNPTDIRAVINLAGAYNQFCDPQNGNYSWTIVDDSVGHKKQRWIYYQHDSFFGEAYRAKVKEASLRAGLQYFEIPGNHAAPLLRPGWTPGALRWFESLQ